MKSSKIMGVAVAAMLAATMCVGCASGTSTASSMSEPPSGSSMSAPPSGSSMGEPPSGGAPGGPGGGTADFEYTAATEITSADTQDGQTYASTTADESALIVNTSEDVTLSNVTVTKTGDSNGGDNCNFYGLNAGLLVMGGSTTTITGGTVETDANGANGIFSYGGNGGRNGA